jgi:hypothetical protein
MRAQVEAVLGNSIQWDFYGRAGRLDFPQLSVLRTDAKIEKFDTKTNFKSKWTHTLCVETSDLSKTPKIYHKISWDYPFKIWCFWCTVLTAFNLTVLYYFSSGNFFQWSLERRFFCFLCIFSVCFETYRFVSKRVNTETNRKKIVIVFAKQTENKPKQIEFRFVSVQPKKKICFEDTLLLSLFRT